MTPDELVVGRVYRCRYDTRNCGSTQGRRVRRIKLVEGPHTDLPMYKHGEIVRVHDLSDPVVPGREKVFYLHRFLRILKNTPPRATLSSAIWKTRGRLNQPQRNARRVVWSDSDDDE